MDARKYFATFLRDPNLFTSNYCSCSLSSLKISSKDPKRDNDVTQYLSGATTKYFVNYDRSVAVIV